MGGKNKQTKQKGRGSAARKTRTAGKPQNGALTKGSAFTNSNASTKLGRRLQPGNKEKAGSRMRSASTIKRLNLYKKKAPKKEELIRQALQPKRIEPDRRWFGNTRVITQKKMEDFRTELSKTVDDPFSVVLKNSKLPLSLLQDSKKEKRFDLLSIETYEHTFGNKKQRKKPKLASYDMETLMAKVQEKEDAYEEAKDEDLGYDMKTGERKLTELKHCKEEIFDKGTSKRIWGELYKVIDSSDVIIQVIDARDPMGTRCQKLERDIKKNHPHKHMILLLNKVDLVPTWVTKRWVEILRKQYPTIAFHASITNPFGKHALIQLLRQFLSLLKDRKHVSIGFIGYPNVGKSSAINTLRKKKVCKAAPVPGETKVWQYIKITSKLYAVDCPGIVPAVRSDFEGDTGKVLKGVVRIEKIQNPSNYVDEVLTRVKPMYIISKYNLPKDTKWEDGEEFLTILAKKMGKLLKGGDPDIETSARIVLMDWQKGRLAYYTHPPMENEEKKQEGETQKAPVEVAEQEFKELKCAMDFDAEDQTGDNIVLQEVAVQRAPKRIKIVQEGEATEDAMASPKNNPSATSSNIPSGIDKENEEKSKEEKIMSSEKKGDRPKKQKKKRSREEMELEAEVAAIPKINWDEIAKSYEE